jgi:hypothetical protein
MTDYDYIHGYGLKGWDIFWEMAESEKYLKGRRPKIKWMDKDDERLR